MNEQRPSQDTRAQWERVFTTRAEDDRSWTQHDPVASLDRIDALGLAPDDPVIDVGGGASRLVDHLLARGHRDLAVLDISASALCQARSRVGVNSGVTWIEADVTTWTPPRQYAVWHDRAVCHFLVDPGDQLRYAQTVADAVRAGGHAIIAAYAPTGPETCSGLPVQRWSAEGLEQLFAASFELVSADELTHRTPAGVDQQFTWVVLRRRPA